jgi:hypothetical protein
LCISPAGVLGRSSRLPGSPRPAETGGGLVAARLSASVRLHPRLARRSTSVALNKTRAPILIGSFLVRANRCKVVSPIRKVAKVSARVSKNCGLMSVAGIAKLSETRHGSARLCNTRRTCRELPRNIAVYFYRANIIMFSSVTYGGTGRHNSASPDQHPIPFFPASRMRHL